MEKCVIEKSVFQDKWHVTLSYFHSVLYLAETGKKNEPCSAVEDEESVTIETNHNSQQAVILALALSGKLETGVRYYSLGTRTNNIKKVLYHNVSKFRCNTTLVISFKCIRSEDQNTALLNASCSVFVFHCFTVLSVLWKWKETTHSRM